MRQRRSNRSASRTSASWSSPLPSSSPSLPSPGSTAAETSSSTATPSPTSTSPAASGRPQSRMGSARLGLAAPASSAHGAIRRQRLALAHRHRRLHPLHACLRSRRSWNLPPGARPRLAAGAALAAAIYALNPSLLYMQSTAMTESIFLAALIWSVVYFDDFLSGLAASRATLAAGRCRTRHRALRLLPRCRHLHPLRRMDLRLHRRHLRRTRRSPWLSTKRPPQSQRTRLLRSMASFLLLLALCPTLWLAHNYKINRHPLDWLNGPTRPRPSSSRSSHAGRSALSRQGQHKVAAQYFLKAARMNTGEGSRENWLIRSPPAEFWSRSSVCAASAPCSCCGFRCPSTPTRSPTAAFPSSFPMVAVLLLQRALRPRTAARHRRLHRPASVGGGSRRQRRRVTLRCRRGRNW